MQLGEVLSEPGKFSCSPHLTHGRHVHFPLPSVLPLQANNDILSPSHFFNVLQAHFCCVWKLGMGGSAPGSHDTLLIWLQMRMRDHHTPTMFANVILRVSLTAPRTFYPPLTYPQVEDDLQVQNIWKPLFCKFLIHLLSHSAGIWVFLSEPLPVGAVSFWLEGHKLQQQHRQVYCVLILTNPRRGSFMPFSEKDIIMECLWPLNTQIHMLEPCHQYDSIWKCGLLEVTKVS